MPSKKRGSEELTTRWRFPHPSTADGEGLLAVGGDMLPGTLVHAYSNGIFPWTSDPITWWSPDPRAVIGLDGVHVSRSLRRVLARGSYEVTFDTAFREVMEGCAASRPGREETWISPRFLTAYCRLFEMGLAHCVECWKDGELAGGLYGVSLGAFFAGESMFSAAENASKVALVRMAERLRAGGWLLFDVQALTPHLASMGAVEVPRTEYLRRLREAVAAPADWLLGGAVARPGGGAVARPGGGAVARPTEGSAPS